MLIGICRFFFKKKQKPPLAPGEIFFSSLSSSCNGQSFTIGLRNTLLPTWTSTTQTLLSLPGNTFTIRPSGHLPLRVSVAITITMSPTFKSAQSLCHFFLPLRLGIHSRNHLCQKWRTSSCTRRHLFLGLKATSLTVSGPNFPPNWP